MFVPDEESARWIESLAAAAAPQLAVGLWPGWDPSAVPVGIVLPGAAGLCVLRPREPGGREVASRDGGPLPGVRFLTWAEARASGLPVTPGTPPRLRGLAGPDGTTVTVRGAGGPAVFVETPGPLPGRPDLAGAVHGALFALWFAARGGPAPAPGGAPDADVPEDAALRAVEGRLMGALLREVPGGGLLRHATALALVRRERRAAAPEETVALEQAREASDGLPAYVAARCAEAAGGVAALEALAAALGELAEAAPGAGARLSGWGLAACLDRVEAEAPESPSSARPWAARADLSGGWKAALASGAVADLDAAFEARLRFDGGSRDDALLRQAKEAHGHDDALSAARRRAETAAHARNTLLQRILRGAGTLVAVDVGALPAPRVDADAPPEAIHAGMAVYARGASFRYAGGTIVEFRGLPLAEDRRSGLLQTRIAARLAFAGDGARMAPGGETAFESGLDLELPGLRVHARAGSIRPIDGGYLIRLLR